MGKISQVIKVKKPNLPTAPEWSDRETIGLIQENPYIQYFTGYRDYQYELSLDESRLKLVAILDTPQAGHIETKHET